MFFEMRFDLGTLDSGERPLPFGLLVFFFLFRVMPLLKNEMEILLARYLKNYLSGISVIELCNS